MDYNKVLKEHGLRATAKRTALVRVLDESSHPLEVRRIRENLEVIGLRVDLSTVYRALECLLEAGLVERISFAEDSKVFYELRRGGHRHYLHCLGCNEIVGLDSCPLKEYQKKLAENTDYVVVSHHLDIYGYCPRCKEKNHD